MRKSLKQDSSEDTDILKLDHDIKQKLLQDNGIDEITRQITILENSLNLENISKETVDNITENITQLRDKLRDSTTKNNYNFYIMETMEIIEKYKVEISKPIVVNFMCNDEDNNQEQNKQLIME